MPGGDRAPPIRSGNDTEGAGDSGRARLRRPRPGTRLDRTDPPAGRPVRPGGHRPAGLADRPVQPALHVLHAGRGAGLAARPRAAHRRRDRPAGRRSRCSGSASTRCGSPAASRCCAGASTDRRRRPPALRPRPEISLTTNGIGLARRGRAAAPRPGWTGSTSRWTRSTRSGSRTLTRRDRLDDVLAGPGRRRRRRAQPGQDQRGAAARRQRRRGACRCCGSRSSTATSCGSSSRCRWTPQHGWDRDEMVTADEILAALRAAFDPDARPGRRRAAAPRPRRWLVDDGGPATGRRDRARSPGRSAATATAPG